MSNVQYTVTLDKALADRLELASKQTKVSVEDLILESVVQHLNVAVRFQLLIDRMDTVDQALTDLAQFVGESLASEGDSFVSPSAGYFTSDDKL